jgi:adenylate cyclase
MEVERKYLLSALPPPEVLGRGVAIRQGYLDATDPEIRLRQKGPVFFLTIKSGQGVRRQECEVRIPAATFEKLWPLTEGTRVVKTRYTVRHGDLRWEIDDFGGSLTNLYVAEVELASESEAVTPPAFLSIVREVTDDPRYKNKSLAARGLPRLQGRARRSSTP